MAGHVNISDFGLKARAFQVCFLTHVRWVGEPDGAAARGAQQPPPQQLGPGRRVTVNKYLEKQTNKHTKYRQKQPTRTSFCRQKPSSCFVA